MRRLLALCACSVGLLLLPGVVSATASASTLTDGALAWLTQQAGTDGRFAIAFDQPYDAAYVGPVSGMVAEPGALDRAHAEVRVFVHTDVDYLMATVPVSADGTFSTPDAVHPGTKIARLVDTRTGRTISSTQWPAAIGGLVRTFAIPQSDPAYGAEGDGSRTEWRSWVYDDALATIAFAQGGRSAAAHRVLERVAALQAPDGSFGFAYDALGGTEISSLRRTGAIAWMGSAALEYERVTGDATFRPMAVRVGDWVLAHQVTTPGDPRQGSVVGGDDVTWASTEHNIDAYFLLRDLGRRTGEPRFADGAASVAASLLTHHWNAAEGRFNQGVGDTADALDLGTWGGLFLLAVGETQKAQQSAAYVERFRVSDGGHTGYQPFLEGPAYPNPPQTVWSEGTWGAVLLRERLGQDVSGDVAQMAALQDGAGGLPQVITAQGPPYDLPAWPCVAATAWAVIATDDDGGFWGA
jgi:hypothetical protein